MHCCAQCAERLVRGSKAFIKPTSHRQNLGQLAEERRITVFMFRFAQSSERGAEQPLCGRDIATFGGQLPFESQTTRIKPAQAVFFSMVLQPTY
jgi:hypothetical protein